MIRVMGILIVCGLILALFALLGCTREVVKEVVVTATPGPASPVPTATVLALPTDAPGPDESENIYQVGISADLTTTNFWAYLGPDGTI